MAQINNKPNVNPNDIIVFKLIHIASEEQSQIILDYKRFLVDKDMNDWKNIPEIIIINSNNKEKIIKEIKEFVSHNSFIYNIKL